MKDKKYILNGKPVDGNGDIVDTKRYNTIHKNIQKNNKTGAEMVGLALAGIVLYAALSIGTITLTNEMTKTADNLSNHIATEQQTQNIKDLGYLYTDIGEKYVIDELTIAANLANCESCKVNGIYYSRNDEKIYSIKVTQKYTETITPRKTTTYSAPAGYVLVGNICYKADAVIEAEKIEKNGETVYVVPNGYILSGRVGIKSSEYNNGIPATETTTYSLPSGYTLDGNVGKRTIQYQTEYLVSEKDYLSKNFEHLIEKTGEYVSHTIGEVETRPMQELYELLGIKYEDQKKLTK